MSAPKKPLSATPSVRAPAPSAELTANQLRAAQLFAALTDQTQEAMLHMMIEMAKDFPRHKRPVLRLIGGGSK
ncbi:hypothetical protein [Burkholderia sp. LMU1-1-1.1]|uniref:hypothetical protein n=1 Tax=Burkholderia sp. LMU1-1-1.1 TaxID=3135266 RepID=UPI003426A36B